MTSSTKEITGKTNFSNIFLYGTLLRLEDQLNNQQYYIYKLVLLRHIIENIIEYFYVNSIGYRIYG